MSKQSRRKFSAEFKARVALEAIKKQKTISELSHQFEVHPVTISKWKAEFLQNMSAAFEREGRPGKEKESRNLDKHLLKHPTEAVVSMAELLKGMGYPVGPKRIRRLFKVMGHQTIYRKKNLTKNALKEIINSDQGSQYTSFAWTNFLETNGIKISMDGKGRATDNAWIERFWKTIKYQHLHLNPCDNGIELLEAVNYYVGYYNQKKHQSIDSSPDLKFYESIEKKVA